MYCGEVCIEVGCTEVGCTEMGCIEVGCTEVGCIGMLVYFTFLVASVLFRDCLYLLVWQFLPSFSAQVTSECVYCFRE